jgi:hypothetical protein
VAEQAQQAQLLQRYQEMQQQKQKRPQALDAGGLSLNLPHAEQLPGVQGSLAQAECALQEQWGRDSNSLQVGRACGEKVLVEENRWGSDSEWRGIFSLV